MSERNGRHAVVVVVIVVVIVVDFRPFVLFPAVILQFLAIASSPFVFSDELLPFSFNLLILLVLLASSTS